MDLTLDTDWLRAKVLEQQDTIDRLKAENLHMKAEVESAKVSLSQARAAMAHLEFTMTQMMNAKDSLF